MEIRHLEEKLNLLASSLEDRLDVIFKRRLDSWLEQTLTVSCISEEIDRKFRINQTDIEASRSDSKRVERDVADLVSMVKAHTKDIDKIKQELENQRLDIRQRAYRNDVKKLNEDLKSFCPLSYAESLKSTVSTKADSKDFQKVEQEFENLKEEVFSTFFTTKKAKKELERIEKIVSGKLSNYATIEALNKGIFEIKSKSGNFDAELENFRGKIRSDFINLSDKLLSQQRQLDSKADKTTIEQLDSKIKKKATNENFEYFKLEVNELTSTASRKIQYFSDVITGQEQAILRLDELILERASKIDIKSLSSKVEAISRHPDLEFKIDDMISQLHKVTQVSETSEKDIGAMKSQLQDLSAFYSKNLSESLQLQSIKDSIKDMHTAMTYKTERSETYKILENKATSSDLKSVKESVSTLHNNIKLVAVQLNALYKIWADPFKGRGHDRTHRDFLANASQKLVDFLVKPKAEDKKLPEDLHVMLHGDVLRERVQSAHCRTRTPSRAYNRSVDLNQSKYL